ncbi:MAG: ABC-2 transporter permease [Butyrivibrio sp.]
MKGLIYKDFLCLRNNLKANIAVTAGVIALAVMFVISSRCGNMADIINNMNGEDSMSKDLFLRVSRMAICIVLLIPMAFAGNVVDCFKEDKRAGFYNTLLGMPVNNKEIIGARYLSLLLYTFTGFICSLIAALSICLASDEYIFGEMVSVVLTFGGVLVIYMSIIMPLLYLFGTDRADIIYSAPIVIIIIAAVVYANTKKVSALSEAVIINKIDSFINFISHKGGLLMGGAILCLICAYFISVKIIDVKRGQKL